MIDKHIRHEQANGVPTKTVIGVTKHFNVEHPHEYGMTRHTGVLSIEFKAEPHVLDHFDELAAEVVELMRVEIAQAK